MNQEKNVEIQQFPPGVYDILTSSSQRIARILSLSGTVPSAPPIQWQSNREHWFTPASITDLRPLLQSATIRVTYVANLGNLQAVATELANASLYRFQLRAKGVLAPSDWVAGTPPWVAPAFYFEQSPLPPAPSVPMRPLLQVSSTDAKKLLATNWLSPTQSLTGYFQNVPVGASVTLASQATSQIPTTGFYYRAV
jgi:hypothetical protein